MFKLATKFLGWTAMNPQPVDRFMLWVDAVGGFLVCLGDEVTLGQPVAYDEVDVPILGDISRRHARIRRDGEGYLIEAIRDVRVDGRPIDKVGPLGNGSRIVLGDNVQMVLRHPHALSGTVRLDFESHHRTQPTADAVLLMGDSLVLGPEPNNHVVCRDWLQDVILFRDDDGLRLHAAGPFEIDGVKQKDRGVLTWNSRVEGDGFSFSLEGMSRG